MRLSARNQLLARVTDIDAGRVNGTVRLELTCGGGLVPDKTVYAVIKATEVMIAAEPVKISARNRIAGTIADISNGAVNGMVLLDIGKGQQISSTISMESIRELDLHVGMEVFAVFKATSVMIGLELDHISFGLM